MSFQLVVPGFLFPPLVVGPGQLLGPGAMLTVVIVGVQDGAQEHDQFAVAVARTAGNGVFDDPDQVGHGQATLVERVRDQVDVVEV